MKFPKLFRPKRFIWKHRRKFGQRWRITYAECRELFSMNWKRSFDKPHEIKLFERCDFAAQTSKVWILHEFSSKKINRTFPLVTLNAVLRKPADIFRRISDDHKNLQFFPKNSFFIKLYLRRHFKCSFDKAVRSFRPRDKNTSHEGRQSLKKFCRRDSFSPENVPPRTQIAVLTPLMAFSVQNSNSSDWRSEFFKKIAFLSKKIFPSENFLSTSIIKLRHTC